MRFNNQFNSFLFYVILSIILNNYNISAQNNLFQINEVNDQNQFNLEHAREHLDQSLTEIQKDSSVQKMVDNWNERQLNQKQFIQDALLTGNTQQLKSDEFNCNSANWGFENGNFSNWTTSGCVSVVNAGVDPYGGFPHVYAGNGGSFSAKLSSDDSWSCKDGMIARTISVPATGQTFFTFHFALGIFNYPHSSYDAAKFKMYIYDENGQLVPCPSYNAYYATTSGPVGVSNLQETPSVTSIYNPFAVGDGPDYYNTSYTQNWNHVTMDLSTFASQNITVFFIAEWCMYNVDWIYALIDMDCPINTTNPQPICSSSFPQTICAPAGLDASLQWNDQNNGMLGTGNCIVVNSSGTYSLKITPNYLVCNSQSNIVLDYEVQQTPTAQFSVNDSCIYSQFTTINSSINASTFEWTYASTSTVSINYVDNYNSDFNSIQLIAFENGCSDTLVKPISPYFVPTALFEIPETGICTNHLIEISNTSFDDSDENLNFVWDFVGGNSSSVTNPTILLPSTGSLTAILVATNTFGCSDTFQMVIQLNEVSEANFEFENRCLYDNYEFENTTNSPIPFFAHWEFGDGTNSTELNPIHTYLTNQSFQVELVIENQLGCRDTISKIAIPFIVPNAQFTIDPVCLYNNQEFINSSEITDNSAMSYQWEIGNEINYWTEDVSHLFDQNDPISIQLIAFSNNGCKDTIQEIFTPLNTPIAHFNFSNQCVGNEYEFHNYSVSPNNSKLKFEWNFGNGYTSYDNNPTHFYQSLGDYEVSLVVMSEDLCSDTLKLIASPFSLPLAMFKMSKTILNEFDSTVDFIDVTEDEIINWNWNLGDNTTANTNQFSHTYNQVADYTVSMIVMNINGCIDTVDQVISLQPSNFIYVPNTFTPNTDEFNPFFHPVISGEGINYETLIISIFNRWGDQIWESRDPSGAWDGTFNGESCQIGTYTWKISFYNTINKEMENLVGHVNLVR